MQTRTSGVMHQYPLRVASGFQTCQHGIGTLITAIYNGDLRMIRQRKLCKTAIAVTYGNDDIVSLRDAPAAHAPSVQEWFDYRLRDIA